MRSATSSTSRSLWVMKMIDFPWLRQRAHDLEQLIGFLRGQHGGGLVEDQDICIAVEQLDDLNPLLHAHRQIADITIRVRLPACTVSKSRGCALRPFCGPGNRPARVDSSPSITFSVTVKTGISIKCWCTMPIPPAMASLGEWTLIGLPRTMISPSSGWYSPYRIFIRVVLPAPFSPSRAWISPCFEGQVDMIIGQYTGETFGNST